LAADVYEYSVIIPVFNRPGELRELLESLARQTEQVFEVLVIDDGSEARSDRVSDEFTSRIPLRYFYIGNSGPASARNYGCKQASGSFLVFFDSDCTLPDDYFRRLREARDSEKFDAYGGPDRDHPDFSVLQRAISYTMTSIFTTGGIRGGAIARHKFLPRSFNMGISAPVYLATGGFSDMRFGEDIDLSLRIRQAGFAATLIAACFVYHKRRTDLGKFFKQVFNSGMARINLYRRHPSSLKLLHFFPALYTVYLLGSVLIWIFAGIWEFTLPLIVYHAAIFFDALLQSNHPGVALLAIPASAIQLTGYGLGFIRNFTERMVLGRPEGHAFRKNFYR
jgi:glycosyltransferase involved in cell wall biosynthesis